MHDFKDGDVVRLKSGGPKMTVSEVSGSDCNCQWFDEKKLLFGYFNSEALVKVEDDEE